MRVFDAKILKSKIQQVKKTPESLENLKNILNITGKNIFLQNDM